MITFRLKSIFLLLMSSFLLVSCTSNRFQQWEIEETVLEFKHRPPEKLFQSAKESLDKKEYNRAIVRFNAFIKLYPTHKNIEVATLSLVSCYALNGQLEEAIQAADDFIMLYPNSPYRKEVERLEYRLQVKRIRSNNDYTYYVTFLSSFFLTFWILRG